MTTQPLGFDQIEQTRAWLEERLEQPPTMALILGSGLGELAEELEDATAFDYDELPHFPTSTVPGHAGRLVFGRMGERFVLAMQGRFHFYEGWRLDQVTFPVRVFASLGCQALLVTNSSGGVREDFSPGDLMLIRDHINFTGANPLVGPNDERLGVRFPDMSDPYDRRLREQALQIAGGLQIPLQEGVYAGVLGPSYETPAEVHMLRALGADAVGMSTVPEVIVANHAGLRVLGVSCITNMASGVTDQPLTHEEVTENAAAARATFTRLVRQLIEDLRL